MIIPDPARVAAIIREAAVTEILPRFKTLAKGDIREKRPGQLVTDADVMAERMLARRLGDLLPGSAVVGEESVEADPRTMGALAGEGPVWILDPVDGTANFAHGRARFAVIVALVGGGETVAGWIHDPVPDRTVIAVKGEGAWREGTRLGVAAERPLAEMTGSIKRGGRVAGAVLKVSRRGSAAHDYLDLVTGGLDFAHFSKLMPWDHAAGTLIHAEAGGYGRLTDGSCYRPVPYAEGQLLLAPGEASWRELAELL